MSELEKVNKFVAKVSPKGEPKLFITSPFGMLIRAYTVEEARIYTLNKVAKDDKEINTLLEQNLYIKEIELIDLVEGDGTHSKVDI